MSPGRLAPRSPGLIATLGGDPPNTLPGGPGTADGLMEQRRNDAIIGHFRVFDDVPPALARLRAAEVRVLSSSDGAYQRATLVAVGPGRPGSTGRAPGRSPGRDRESPAGAAPVTRITTLDELIVDGGGLHLGGRGSDR